MRTLSYGQRLLSSVKVSHLAGISTISDCSAVAGRHRASPSASLDKSVVYSISFIIATAFSAVKPFFQKNKKKVPSEDDTERSTLSHGRTAHR